METVRLVVKNYRCFSDQEPLQIEIGPGFIGVVGPNNSGKSTLKLLFYELRLLFQILGGSLNQAGPNLALIFSPQHSANINYQGITDPYEIFHNGNERPIVIEIEVLPPSGTTANVRNDNLFRVIARCERNAPNTWYLDANSQAAPQVSIIRERPQTPSITDTHSLTFNTPNVQPNIKVLNCRIFIEAMRALYNSKYYGPFRNAINQGAGDHYDLSVGSAFVNLWGQWKTAGIRYQMRAIDGVTDDIRRLFEFEHLEINASTALNTLIVSINNESFKLNELGSGLAQFIIVLGNAATQLPEFIMIDEPETNLHPSLQIDFLLSLAKYSKNGVIFSTHSVGLARSVAEKIYSIQRSPRGAVVTPFEATPNYIEFIGELSFSSFEELGSDRLLLVEGVNDVKAMQQLLRLVKKRTQHSNSATGRQ